MRREGKVKVIGHEGTKRSEGLKREGRKEGGKEQGIRKEEEEGDRAQLGGGAIMLDRGD